MEKNIIRTDKAPAPIGPYNQAVQVGNMLFVSGQIALDPTDGSLHEGDVKSETEIVMKNLHAILQAAGMDFRNVVKTSIFLMAATGMVFISVPVFPLPLVPKRLTKEDW